MHLTAYKSNKFRFKLGDFEPKVQWPLEVTRSQIELGIWQIWIHHTQIDILTLIANFDHCFMHLTAYKWRKFRFKLGDFDPKVQWPLEVTRGQIELGIWQIWIQHTQIDKITLVVNFDHCLMHLTTYKSRKYRVKLSDFNHKFIDLWRSPEVR